MNAVDQLQRLHFRVRVGDATWRDYIDWAVERLRCDEEGDDLDVVMLASARVEDEARLLVLQIVERYIGPGALGDELAAGKFIAEMYVSYHEGAETTTSLEPKFWRLFYDLQRPSWLMMLARNCEYATDTPPFQRPFEQEFEYIAGLWSKAQTLQEFLFLYDRKVSASHDAI